MRDDRKERLLELCIEAHKQGVERRTPTPAEMVELSHLRMRVTKAGIPVLRVELLRDDEIEEYTALLAGRTSRARRLTTVKERVIDHMEAYGPYGLRIQDVCAAVEAAKPPVLRVLQGMIEDGLVYVKQEPTRKGGSHRKRYFTHDPLDKDLRVPLELKPDRLHVEDARIGRPDADGTGIIHHGTGVAGCYCPCPRCKEAFEREVVGEQISVARAFGERKLAFSCGLAAHTRAREEADAEFRLAVLRGNG